MADAIDTTIEKLHSEGATDEEITSIIKEKFGKPFDVKAQNETMRANMAAQDEAANRQPASQWSRPAMGARVISGLKGELEGAAGGLAGLAALPGAAYTAIRHPVDTAQGIGAGAMLAGHMIGQVADNPSAALSSATDAAKRFGSDPEKIGALAGGVDVAIATPAVTRYIRGTRIGQAVGTGLSSAVDRIPGVKAARAAWDASAPTVTPDISTRPPIPAGIGRPSSGPTPLEYTQSLKPTGAALEQARAEAFAPPPSSAPVAVAPVTGPQSPAMKPSFSSQDVLKIRLLMQQGISQDKAVELVKSSSLGPFVKLPH